MIKSIYFLTIVLLVLFFGCKKENKTSSVEIRLLYKSKTGSNYLPDVDAGVYLYKQKGKAMIMSARNRMGMVIFEGDQDYTRPDYSGKADVNGVVSISGVEDGNYNIVVGSKARIVWSYKNIDINGDISLVKNFSDSDEYSDKSQSW
ncbi:hypothetical protein Pedsa_0391 [Pseudopedobacter saltans DSM 12145]|uniref:Uncharacterized protein n=1 Tax=Pseudopedobacter saltans (strain ATCC 51119 / DSM 12145 / JCM 21818 / CCUG 39354 / LMG 10337 / NBRC 100064 / NCIMB 13643) TaxID=762903 RepID=F0S556_PSESL|nr:hypothetical protein [Pseudopedobacter saltans]ADY50973.1 hypothetical protein Pedsa_0391 [Pseudopedobacter saltans DSM 12145]